VAQVYIWNYKDTICVHLLVCGNLQLSFMQWSDYHCFQISKML
jgi:hypothetical protein